MKHLFIALSICLVLLFGCTSQPQQNAGTEGGASLNKTGEQMSKGNTSIAKSNGYVKKGDTVSVDYVGTLENGTLFDTSVEAEAAKAGLTPRPSYEPLSFTVGAGQMIKGFDDAVVGMKVGESKTISLPPAEAYGEVDPTRVISVPADKIQSDGRNVTVGGFVYTPSGARGVIVSVNATDASIDFNHPLAGKTLIFKITLRSIGAN